MRTLGLQEHGLVAGGDAGDIKCSAGFPSGVKCEGSLKDTADLAVDAWNILASVPGTAPYVVEKLLN